jgi:calcineurin-like phosphoesterase family protein
MMNILIKYIKNLDEKLLRIGVIQKMYNQIINILKQNKISTENIYWQDQSGQCHLNNDEKFEQSIMDCTRNSMRPEDITYYLWILQENKERKFTIIQSLSLMNCVIYILREENNDK